VLVFFDEVFFLVLEDLLLADVFLLTAFTAGFGPGVPPPSPYRCR
jgi:hypothetical protein